MGGGGDGDFGQVDIERVRKLPGREVDTSIVRVQLAELFREQLGSFNARPADAHREKLESLLASCHVSPDDRLELLFGGSVSKHTYVDGLSDVDCLVVVGDGPLADNRPQTVLAELRKRIVADVDGSVDDVTTGAIAVTVRFKDGTIIQLIPAMRTDEGMLVPAWGTDRWSAIDPSAFARGLTTANDRCGRKLVPVIKLVKGMIARLPSEQRPTGYHVESLAIEAFKRYTGELSYENMIVSFFAGASRTVLSPIRDKTGQSRHVDEYLGDADSGGRQAMAHVFEQMAKRLTLAIASGDVEAWREQFEE